MHIKDNCNGTLVTHPVVRRGEWSVDVLFTLADCVLYKLPGTMSLIQHTSVIFQISGSSQQRKMGAASDADQNEKKIAKSSAGTCCVCGDTSTCYK